MIGLTQSLLYYGLMPALYTQFESSLLLNDKSFWLLMLSTIFMTAYGYVINDIYDVETDRINKPESLIVDNRISKNKAFILSILLLTVSLILAAILCFYRHIPNYFILFPAIGLGLWWYAAQLKALPLVGNILVSFLSAFSLAIVGLFEYALQTFQTIKNLQNMWIVIAAYSLFAFLLSMIRELIKDVEDIEGDQACQMRTFPIVAGIKNTKRVVGVLGLLCLLLLVGSIDMLLILGWSKILAIYLSVAVLIPMGVFLLRLQKSQSIYDFSYLSTFAKLIMLSGILSMLWFL